MSLGTRNQHQHLVRLTTQLENDAIQVRHLSARVAMSSMGNFSLQAFSDTHHNIQPKDLIATPAALTIMDENGEPIYYHSYITHLQQIAPAGTGEATEYAIELKPWLYFLGHDSDCRIFQNKTVIDVINEILTPYRTLGDYKIIASDTYPQKRYQIQYNETNLDFFNRLCHDAGLAYFFVFEQSKHTLYITDNKTPPAPLVPQVLEYQPNTQAKDHLHSWSRSGRYATGNFEHRAYNYKTPFATLEGKRHTKESVGEIPRVLNTSNYHYVEDFKDHDETEARAITRIEQLAEKVFTIHGSGDCRYLKIGHHFTALPVPSTTFFPDRDKVFTLVEITINASNEGFYQANFTAIPRGDIVYPESRRTLVSGLQTAVVTGPEGEEIYTDKEGRIKVQFHWDRVGKRDQNTTCWLRVMQSFSGPEFGGHYTPRIGQEVVVAFENGNPDRPFVLGGLHHVEHIPPFHHDLGLRAGMRTRSSKGASTANCNEVSFYDLKGSEEMFFHAEKDHNSKILHNRAERINNHDITSVGGNRSAEVEGNQQEKVGGSMNLSIGGGPGVSVLGMIAGVMAAGSGDAQKGSGSVGNALLSKFVGALASASSLAETLSLPANQAFNKAANHVKRGGKDQSATASSLGDLLSKIMPIGGIFNTVVEKFKSDTIGIARTEQIGAYKNTTVGHTQTINVGDTQTTNVGDTQEINVGKFKTTVVGDEYKITVGKSSVLLKKDGTVHIAGENITLCAGADITLRAKKTIVLKAKKITEN